MTNCRDFAARLAFRQALMELVTKYPSLRKAKAKRRLAGYVAELHEQQEETGAPANDTTGNKAS